MDSISKLSFRKKSNTMRSCWMQLCWRNIRTSSSHCLSDIMVILIHEEVDHRAKSLSLAHWLSLKSPIFSFKLFILLHYYHNYVNSAISISVSKISSYLHWRDFRIISAQLLIFFIMTRGAIVGLKLSDYFSRWFISLLICFTSAILLGCYAFFSVHVVLGISNTFSMRSYLYQTLLLSRKLIIIEFIHLSSVWMKNFGFGGSLIYSLVQ